MSGAPNFSDNDPGMPVPVNGVDAKHAGDEENDQELGRRVEETLQRADRKKAEASDEHAEYLASLKSDHKTALQELKSSLQYEKDYRLQELEDRLMRRKLARKKNAKGITDTDNADLLAGDQEIEDQIVVTKQQFENLEDGMISGLKKRCLMETKLAKEKGLSLWMVGSVLLLLPVVLLCRWFP